MGEGRMGEERKKGCGENVHSSVKTIKKSNPQTFVEKPQMTPTTAYEHVPGLKGLQVLTCVLIVVIEILGLGRWKSKNR